MAKHYRELIPHADVVELEGIGHDPPGTGTQGSTKRLLSSPGA
jgi:hypothetical protein